MNASFEVSEIFDKATIKTIAEPFARWIEGTLGLDPKHLLEHIVVETVATLLATAVIGLSAFLVSRQLWIATKRRWRAATIKKIANEGFVIVRCPIEGDTNETIGNEISARLETAFRVFAGWKENELRPFHIVSLPLVLAAEGGTNAYDVTLNKAKKWLDRTDGDILIWGKRIKNDSVGIIRLIGRDLKTGTIETRRIDFDQSADEFDTALANAIAFEAARLTQIGLSEPESVSLAEIRALSNKLKRLAATSAPAVSKSWQRRIENEYIRLVAEIVRQTASSDERAKLEAEARLVVSNINPMDDPLRFADGALNLGILLRKKNWAERAPEQLSEARSWCEEAANIFESNGVVLRATEAALELLQIRRMELVAFQLEDEDETYTAITNRAVRLVDTLGQETYHQRLAAIAFCNPPIKELLERYSFDKLTPLGPKKFVEKVASYLDNGELIDVLSQVGFIIGELSDETFDTSFYDMYLASLEATKKARSSWTKPEMAFLNAMIAETASAAAQRNMERSGSQQAYSDIYRKAVSEIEATYDCLNQKYRNYIDFRILAFLGHYIPTAGPDAYQAAQRSIEMVRICVNGDADRFPRLQESAKVTLVVALNNVAVLYSSLEAALEAANRAGELKRAPGGPAYIHYVHAFANWQVARLKMGDDREFGLIYARQARALCDRALEATTENNRFLISVLQKLIRSIEADFIELSE